jgi:hypothetical protein
MTRNEAIQIQIDECLDNFNAEECAKVCEFLWRRGNHNWPEDWHDSEGTFFPSELRRHARKLLRRVAQYPRHGAVWSASSWLFVTMEEGIDDETGKPYLTLNLLFRVSTLNTHDGTCYGP